MIDVDKLLDAVYGAINIMDAHGMNTISATVLKAIVKCAPTIDAIPVEWLRHRLTMAQKNGSAHPEQAIRYVLWLWEQQKDGEQEAR